jgi:hypothetical protein
MMTALMPELMTERAIAAAMARVPQSLASRARAAHARRRYLRSSATKS